MSKISKMRAYADIPYTKPDHDLEVNLHIWLNADPPIYGFASDNGDAVFLRAAGERSIRELADTLTYLGDSIREQLDKRLMRGKQYAKRNTA